MKKNFLNKALLGFKKSNILCVGDIILDIFVEGDANRISPEAPVPILLIKNFNYQLGGAANVARNIKSLGGQVGILGIIGNDSGSKEIKKLFNKEEKIRNHSIKDKNYKLSTKTRYLTKSHQLLRVDNESENKINKTLQQKIITRFKYVSKDYDTIILSNYKKGLLSKEAIRSIISYSNKKNKIVLIDPKYRDFSIYKNAKIITPNLKELSVAANKEVYKINDIVKICRDMIGDNFFDHVLVTLAERGMLLVSRSAVKYLPTTAKDVYDVTGAGDTVISVIALGMDSGLSIEDSASIANYAAGIVVGKKGTAITTKKEIFGIL